MKKIFSRVMVVVMLASLLGVLRPYAPQAAAAPITCEGRAFFVRAQSGLSQLYELKESGSGSTQLNEMYNDPTGLTVGGTPISDTGTYPSGFLLNGLAYNPVDGYVYVMHINGSNTSEDTLYRVHDDGDLELVATVTLPGADNHVKGATFDTSGVYYGLTQGGSLGASMITITGLASAPATPATVSAPVTVTGQTVEMGDVVYDYTSSLLYAVDNNDGNLVIINPTTGEGTDAVSGVPTNGPGVSMDANGIGSVFLTSTGELRAYVNNDGSGSGQLVSIDKSTNDISFLRTGTATANSDGTSCVPTSGTIDVVKSVASMQAQSATTFTVTYNVNIGNLGTIALPNVQAVDNLALTFADGSPSLNVTNFTRTSGTCTINSGYNGTSEYQLLSGTDTFAADSSCAVSLTVRVTYDSADDVPSERQLNTVLASATATGPNTGHVYNSDGSITEPFNVLATDTSSDAPQLPADENSDNPTPTPVTLSYTAPPASQSDDDKDTPTPDVPDTGFFLLLGKPLSVLFMGFVAAASVWYYLRLRRSQP